MDEEPANRFSRDWFREHWALVPIGSPDCDLRQVESRRGDCRLIDIDVGPCRGERGESRITAASLDGFYITLYHGGGLDFTIGGRDYVLERGDILIWDPAAPSSFSSRIGSSGTTIQFPQTLIERQIGHIAPLSSFKANNNDPRISLLRAHLHHLCSIIGDLSENQSMDLLGSTLELAYSCAIKDRIPSKLKRQRALREEVRSDIGRNLGIESLTPSATARRLGICVRQLQEALAAQGVTFTELVTRERMSRAGSLLRSTDARTMPIQEIALSLGFYDTAHFSNAFRRQYGMSPRQYRNSH